MSRMDHLSLYKIDEYDLFNGHELSDAIIHAGQMLLIKSSPNVNGLQNSVMGKGTSVSTHSKSCCANPSHMQVSSTLYMY